MKALHGYFLLRINLYLTICVYVLMLSIQKQMIYHGRTLRECNRKNLVILDLDFRCPHITLVTHTQKILYIGPTNLSAESCPQVLGCTRNYCRHHSWRGPPCQFQDHNRLHDAHINWQSFRQMNLHTE
jgi:hypothetical protein